MKGLAWWSVLLGSFVTACGPSSSGQTGSPSCSSPLSCECQVLEGPVLVKASVLANDGKQLTLLIEDQLTPSSSAGGANYVHEPLVGPLSNSGAYSGTCGPVPGAFAVGDAVFASFYPSTQCPEYDDCFVYHCGNKTLEACDADCSSECDPDTVYSNGIWLQPWGDTIAISSATTLSPSEAAVLADPASCEQAYPSLPAQQCNDTSQGGAGDGCAVSRFSGRAPAGSSAVVCGLAVAWLARRRRARHYLP